MPARINRRCRIRNFNRRSICPLTEKLHIRHGDVVSFIGSGGKTTSIITTANELAAHGLRVAVTTTTKMGIREKGRLDSTVSFFGTEMGEKLNAPPLGVIDSLCDSYDVVLIDCQPSLGLLAVNALTAAHGVIVPVEAEFFALRGVALLVETIETVRDRINPRLKIDGIVATMVDSRTLHSREVLQRLQEAFGDLVFDTRIGRTIKFPDASVATEPITSYAPNHAGAHAYRRLAREVIARGDAA